jgi:hypothetical protein
MVGSGFDIELCGRHFRRKHMGKGCKIRIRVSED